MDKPVKKDYYDTAPNGKKYFDIEGYESDLEEYRKPSSDTKQVRFFFHVIANYIKMKRILNTK